MTTKDLNMQHNLGKLSRTKRSCRAVICIITAGSFLFNVLCIDIGGGGGQAYDRGSSLLRPLAVRERKKDIKRPPHQKKMVESDVVPSSSEAVMLKQSLERLEILENRIVSEIASADFTKAQSIALSNEAFEKFVLLETSKQHIPVREVSPSVELWKNNVFIIPHIFFHSFLAIREFLGGYPLEGIGRILRIMRQLVKFLGQVCIAHVYTTTNSDGTLKGIFYTSRTTSSITTAVILISGMTYLTTKSLTVTLAASVLTFMMAGLMKLASRGVNSRPHEIAHVYQEVILYRILKELEIPFRWDFFNSRISLRGIPELYLEATDNGMSPDDMDLIKIVKKYFATIRKLLIKNPAFLKNEMGVLGQPILPVLPVLDKLGTLSKSNSELSQNQV